jgi:hypothetical protein
MSSGHSGIWIRIQIWTGIKDVEDYPIDQFGRQVAELGHFDVDRLGVYPNESLLCLRTPPPGAAFAGGWTRTVLGANQRARTLPTPAGVCCPHTGQVFAGDQGIMLRHGDQSGT